MLSKLSNWKSLFLCMTILAATLFAAGCETTFPEATGKMTNQPNPSEVQEPWEASRSTDQEQDAIRLIRQNPYKGSPSASERSLRTSR